MAENVWQKLKKEHKPFMVLAPLEDVTDFVFRQIVAETCKPDLMFTEFTHSDALTSEEGYPRIIHNFKFSPEQKPLIAQIWGTNPDNFRKAAEIARKFGFDGVDINMGCPVKDVLKQGACSALIANPTLAAEIIRATKEGAGDLPVSVKTRIGLKKIETENWIGFLLKQDLAALTVHGRTSKEMSKVPCHWDEIGKAVKLRDEIAPQTVLIGNGDVLSYDDAVAKQKEFGVDGVMIGRGIFHNPWVFEKDASEHSVQERLDLLLKHTKLWVETYGEGKRFEVMKKFFKMYVSGFEGAVDLRVRLMECKSFKEVHNILS